MSGARLFSSARRAARICAAAFFVFAVSIVAAAQSPTPTPESETIRVNTDLIQTNVTVLDKSGRFVDGLKQEQFELRVDGKLVPIEFFERVTAGSEDEEKQINAVGGNGNARLPKDSTGSVARGRTIIFFVDDVHLSADSLKRTRDALAYFIENKMGITDRVAVASTSGQIGFLQQFTDNKAVLRAAVARLQPKAYSVLDTEQPTMSEYMALKIEEREPNATGYYVERCLHDNPGMSPGKCLETVRFRARQILQRAAAVTDNTFYSLESLMRSMTTVVGRKIIMLVSDGFYLSAGDKNTNSFQALARVTDAARRTGSVIYTIDARGLVSGQPDASGNLIDGNGVLDRANIGEITASQDALNALAMDTGGRAQRNSNSIGKWVSDTLQETSNYYLLAWQPEKEQTGKQFKQIEVNIAGQPDLTVRLPRGYLTSLEKSDNKIKGNKKENSAKKTAETVAPTFAPTAAQPISAKKLIPTKLSLKYLDVPNVGGVLTSSVQISTDALDYGAGGSQAAVDLAGIVLNDQGKQIADFKTGLNVAASKNKSETSGQSIIYNNRTPLAPGIYQVKVATRETASGQVGGAVEWVEIPDLTKRELTMGSLFLGAEEVKNTEKSGDVSPQVQFSVDQHFARPLRLNFLSFVYNAAQDKTPNGTVNLAIQIEIYDAQNRVIVSSPMRSLAVNGTNDLARIPLSGSIRRDAVAPGTYLLRITLNDLSAKKTAVQQTVFTVE